MSYNKKKRKIIDTQVVIYPLSVVVFYAFGTVLCSVHLPPEELSGSFFAGMQDKGMMLDLCKGWLYHFVPFVVILLSGYDHLGKVYAFLSLGIRSYLSGYSGAAFISCGILERSFLGIFKFTAYTLVESMILLILLSAAVEQERFRKYYITLCKTPFKCGVNKKYFTHNLLRCGIMVLVYLSRCALCRFTF